MELGSGGIAGKNWREMEDILPYNLLRYCLKFHEHFLRMMYFLK